MPAFLIPLLVGLAPKVAEWVAGKNAGSIVEKVTEIARKSIGVNSIDELESAIASDPNKALEFKLAMINAASEEKRMEHESSMAQLQGKVDEVKAYLEDVQSARNQTVELAKSHSYIAWGSVVISVLVMSAFGVMLYITATYDIPPSQKDNVSGLLWTLNTLAVAVVSYWVGSSAGSAQKSSLMELMSKK